MITNIQLPLTTCPHHTLPQTFLCQNTTCKFIGLSCCDCIKLYHSNHLIDVQNVEDWMEGFRTKVQQMEKQVYNDSKGINIRTIVDDKIKHTEQYFKHLKQQIVSMLDYQQDLTIHRLKKVQQKYLTAINQHQNNITSRTELLQYLSALKNNRKVLQARLLSSNESGIQSIRSCLQRLSQLRYPKQKIQQTIQQISQQTSLILFQKPISSMFQNLINTLTSPIHPLTCQNIPFQTSLCNIMPQKPQSSRCIEDKRKNHSFGELNQGLMQNRMTSNPNFKINQNNKDNKEQSHSLSRDSSRASTREDRFVKGLRRLKLSSILRV